VADSLVPFKLAKTINDANEIHIPVTKQYLTLKEIALIGGGIPVVYMAGAAILGGNSLITIGAIFLYMWVACNFVNSVRKKMPNKQSYIWDFFYRCRFFQEQRSWMRSQSKEKVLGCYHQCAVHKFLGSKKVGDILAVDIAYRRVMPPGGGVVDGIIDWRRLAIGRGEVEIARHAEAMAQVDSMADDETLKEGKRVVRITPLTRGFPAPAWWYGPDGAKVNALGHERSVHIYLPLARRIVPAAVREGGRA
jgi:hypothetical protein